MMSMTTYFCPQCKAPGLVLHEDKKLYCNACEFTYFHNVAAAVAGIITVADQLLLIRRASEPGQGKLGLPGGFVDPREDAEQAMRRELEEEIGIHYQGPLTYFGSWANNYHYKNIDYQTQDIYYQIKLSEKPEFILAADEVSEVLWVDLEMLELDSLAFASAKKALAILKALT